MRCPNCGINLNRRTDGQLFAMCGLMSVIGMAPVWLHLPFGSIFVAIPLGIGAAYLFDVATVRLRVAGRRRGIWGYEVPRRT